MMTEAERSQVTPLTLIGIGYKARVGKDTVGQYLVDQHGFQVLHFADALYEECRSTRIVYVEDRANDLQRVTIDPSSYALAGEGARRDERVERLLAQVAPWIKTAATRVFEDEEVSRWEYPGMREKDAVLLQWYGTEFRRTFFGQDYWLRRLKRTIDLSPADRFVICDVRFPNEVDFIRQMGMSEPEWFQRHMVNDPSRPQKWMPRRAPCRSALWKVDGEPKEDTGRPADHPSEVELDGYDEWDEVIRNDDTLEELYEKGDQAWKRLR